MLDAFGSLGGFLQIQWPRRVFFTSFWNLSLWEVAVCLIKCENFEVSWNGRLISILGWVRLRLIFYFILEQLYYFVITFAQLHSYEATVITWTIPRRQYISRDIGRNCTCFVLICSFH